MGFPVVLVVESPSASAGGLSEAGSIPASGRSPGGGQGDPVQCSCPENPTDRGAWWAAVQGVTQSWARLKPRVYPDCWGKGGREAGGRMRRKEGTERAGEGSRLRNWVHSKTETNQNTHSCTPLQKSVKYPRKPLFLCVNLYIKISLGLWLRR